MSSKGIVVGYIDFSKLSQRSSQNQVDYTWKNVYFFFFGGDTLWVGERCCFWEALKGPKNEPPVQFISN